MDTRPLDAPGLARAARHTVWTGLPAGTVVGHVHLHVGDLSEADGYHHHLALNTWAAGATPASDDDARLLAWELVLPTVADVDAAAASLADAGHQVVREGSEVRANDPWNTTLRIVHRTADS